MHWRRKELWHFVAPENMYSWAVTVGLREKVTPINFFRCRVTLISYYSLPLYSTAQPSRNMAAILTSACGVDVMRSNTNLSPPHSRKVSLAPSSGGEIALIHTQTISHNPNVIRYHGTPFSETRGAKWIGRHFAGEFYNRIIRKYYNFE